MWWLLFGVVLKSARRRRLCQPFVVNQCIVVAETRLQGCAGAGEKTCRALVGYPEQGFNIVPHFSVTESFEDLPGKRYLVEFRVNVLGHDVP